MRDVALRQRVIDECLIPYLMDGRDAWTQDSEGFYSRVGTEGHSAQQALMARYRAPCKNGSPQGEAGEVTKWI